MSSRERHKGIIGRGHDLRLRLRMLLGPKFPILGKLLIHEARKPAQVQRGRRVPGAPKYIRQT